ncbi:MAG TPA: hypothetical protein ENJ06_01975 [Phycisphaeraceae bacterium]|nr:hypothetical protein [Phycisphaeraceae bacterium]
MNEITEAVGKRFTPSGTRWYWPIVFRSLGQSLQGPRLFVGLLMIIIFMAAGSVWDGVSPVKMQQSELQGNIPSDPVSVLLNSIHGNTFQSGISVFDDKDIEQLQNQKDLTIGQFRKALLEKWEARKDKLLLQIPQARDKKERERLTSLLDKYRKNTGYLLNMADRYEPKPVFYYTVTSLRHAGLTVVNGFWTMSPAAAWAGIGEAWGEINILLKKIWSGHKVFSVVFALILVFLWCIGGGAISRMTALDMTRGKSIRASEGLGFTLAKLADLLLGLFLFPLLAVFFGIIIAVIWGVLLRFPGLNVLGGILYVIALLLGLLMVLISVGFLGSFSLMIPAVAVESSDAYDSQQRAYAYLLARPGLLLLYTALALLQGIIAVTLLWLILLWTLNLTAWLASLIGGGEVITMAGGLEQLAEQKPLWMLGGSEHLTGIIIGVWRYLAAGMVGAFIISFYFSSQTIIYLLMRRAVDGEEIEKQVTPEPAG